MASDVLEIYTKYFVRAIQEISAELLDTDFDQIETLDDKLFNNQKKLDVIVGLTGNYKGRLLLETTEKTAYIITEMMNYGPLEEENDLYLYIGEFVNMLSGRAITYINNLNIDRIVRLTPPAIFTGVDLEITTPNIESTNIYFGKNNIQLKMDIGIEGV